MSMSCCGAPATAPASYQQAYATTPAPTASSASGGGALPADWSAKLAPVLQQLTAAIAQLNEVLKGFAGGRQAQAGAAALGGGAGGGQVIGGAAGADDPEIIQGGGPATPIEPKPSPAAPPAPAADPAAAPSGDTGGMPNDGKSLRPMGELTPDQFTSEIGPEAACGPASVVALGRFVGKDLDVTEVTRVAQENGWWNEADGMQGPDSVVKLLDHFGIKAHKEDVDWDKAKETVKSGQPVIMNLPGHYWVAEQYRDSDGKFNFGKSGSVFKSTDETWHDYASMKDVQGASEEMRAFIYLDPQ